ncbi:MAG TPA: YciI family protein [Candidatus Acidoferrales bacterium]|nr:YciI family protein [Candidatus Acidoferrales bacterium]
MRFLVLVKANAESEAGVLPTADEFAAMNAFNQTLVRDGVLLAAEGLQPSAKGARISYASGKPTVTDGPFTETKELIAGFWLLQARSKAEVIERLSRCPFQRGEEIEIRQLYESEDLGGLA